MSRTTADALWITTPGCAEIRREPLPPCGPDDVVVRTLYSGISRGTEALVFQGRVPVSEYERMRAPFQAGTFPAPVKYGYQNVGIVEEGPSGLVGRAVFCLHPHQTRYVVPAADVLPLPDGVPPSRAILAANMETAVNALWDGGAGIGDRITVVGAGVLGCLVAYLALRLPGTAVTLVDIDPGKEPVARQLGARFAQPDEADGDADLLVHTSATAGGLATSLRLAGAEATVLELSWYGDAPVSAPLGASFHVRRLTLKSSQVGAVSPSRRPRWSHRRRLALALTFLADPVLDVLINEESSFETLPETMQRLAREPTGVLCHRVVYPQT